jgi:hypothetical protein
MVDEGDQPCDTVRKEAGQEVGYQVRGIDKVLELYNGAEEYRHRDKAGGHPGHRITSLDGPYWAFMPLPADTAELACRMTAVCLLRERINFAIDDLTFVIMHFQTHPNRDSILKAGGAQPASPAVTLPGQRYQEVFKTMTSASSTSPSSSCRCCKPPMANGGSAIS